VHKVVGTVNLHPFQQMALFSVGQVEETALEHPLAGYQFMAVLEEAVHRPELVEFPRLQEMVVIIRLQASDSHPEVAVVGKKQVHRVQYASLFSRYKVECPRLFTIRRARRSPHQPLQEFQTLRGFSHRPQTFRRLRVQERGRNPTTLTSSS
jgi:hypothetical protein